MIILPTISEAYLDVQDDFWISNVRIQFTSCAQGEEVKYLNQAFLTKETINAQELRPNTKSTYFQYKFAM